MSGTVVLFLLVDGATKLMMTQPVVDANVHLGYPPELVRPIGNIDLVCAALFAIPRTVLGAILTTGLLGGAVAAKLRLEQPLFSHVLFGVYIGVLAWGGLYLPDAQADVQEYIVEDNRVAVRFVVRSKAAGETFGIPILDFFTVRQGMIIRDDGQFNNGGRPRTP